MEIFFHRIVIPEKVDVLKKKRRAAQFFLCLMVPKAGCLKGGCLNPPGVVPKGS